MLHPGADEHQQLTGLWLGEKMPAETTTQAAGKAGQRERRRAGMRYDFLVETYETERIKVLSVWSEFRDEDLPVRPRAGDPRGRSLRDRKSTRLNSSHQIISYAVFCLKKKKKEIQRTNRTKESE